MDCKPIFMRQLQQISYFNIYVNIVLYLCQLITTLYQFKNFSHSLFHLHLVFYKQMFVQKKLLFIVTSLMAYSSYFTKIALESSGNKSSVLGL